jgi:hypothetical protein
MAAKREPSYSFRFYGRGGFISASKLRYATKFSILRNGKVLVPATEFPRNKRKADLRRDYLHNLVVKIEIKRHKILANRRKQYRRKIKDEGLSTYKRRVKRRLKAKPDRIAVVTKKDLKYIERGRESERQMPVFSKAEEAEELPINKRGKAVRDAMIIPVEPNGKKFSTQIIDKLMLTQGYGTYHLATLDFNLKKKNYIRMSRDTFAEAYAKAFREMIPSVLDYFNETKKSSQLYILRIKFLNRWDVLGSYSAHGISYYRVKIESQSEMINLFRHTFMQLLGPQDRHDLSSRGFLRHNYLTGENAVFITGLSLEAMEPYTPVKR